MCSTRVWTARARPVRSTQPPRSCSGIASSSISGPRSTFRSPSSKPWCGCWRRAPRGWVWSRRWCSSGWRRPATTVAGLTIRVTDPPIAPLRELDGYAQKVIKACRRGAMYPYELIPMITRSVDRKRGWLTTFTEYDLDPGGAGGPGARWQHREPGARGSDDGNPALPGGHDQSGAAGRSDHRAGRDRRTGVPTGARGHRAGTAAGRADRMVRRVGASGGPTCTPPTRSRCSTPTWAASRYR